MHVSIRAAFVIGALTFAFTIGGAGRALAIPPCTDPPCVPYQPGDTPNPRATNYPFGPIDNSTAIFANMLTALDTRTAQRGQKFSMIFSHISDSENPLFAWGGATISGHIGDVQRAGGGKKARIAFVFDRVNLPGSDRGMAFVGHVVSIYQQPSSSGASVDGRVLTAPNLMLRKATPAPSGFDVTSGAATGNVDFVIPANSNAMLQLDAGLDPARAMRGERPPQG